MSSSSAREHYSSLNMPVIVSPRIYRDELRSNRKLLRRTNDAGLDTRVPYYIRNEGITASMTYAYAEYMSIKNSNHWLLDQLKNINHRGSHGHLSKRGGDSQVRKLIPRI